VDEGADDEGVVGQAEVDVEMAVCAGLSAPEAGAGTGWPAASSTRHNPPTRTAAAETTHHPVREQGGGVVPPTASRSNHHVNSVAVVAVEVLAGVEQRPVVVVVPAGTDAVVDEEGEEGADEDQGGRGVGGRCIGRRRACWHFVRCRAGGSWCCVRVCGGLEAG
jgi:hypothetical protein